MNASSCTYTCCSPKTCSCGDKLCGTRQTQLRLRGGITDPLANWKGPTAFVRKKLEQDHLPVHQIQPSDVKHPITIPTALCVVLPRPRRSATFETRPLSWVLSKFGKPPPSPFFYVLFQYEDDGEWRQCKREELCRAFRTLVREWNSIRLWSAGLQRFSADAKNSMTVEQEIAYEAEDRFPKRLAVLNNRCGRILQRLSLSATHLGDYLDFLSRCEDENKHSRVWHRCPQPVTARDVRLPHVQRRLCKHPDGAIDDFAFRAAKAVNSSQTPEEVRILRAEIVTTAIDVLKYCGVADPVARLQEYFPGMDEDDAAGHPDMEVNCKEATGPPAYAPQT